MSRCCQLCLLHPVLNCLTVGMFINFCRSQFLPALIEQVRLPLLSQEYLIQRVEVEPLLRSNSLCKDFIIEAMKFHLLKGDLKLQMSLTSPRTKPRQPIGLPKVMLAIGGQAPKAIRCVGPHCNSRCLYTMRKSFLYRI